jgi:hypothetical protein
MKKYLHPTNLPILVPIAAILALALRLWTMGDGADSAGLYAPQPIAWVLLWIVTGATMALIYHLTRRLKNPGRYGDNFPASILGAVGCALGGLGILSSALTTFPTAKDLLATLTAVLGLISAAALIWSAVVRYTGGKPHFCVHAIPCLYFALRIFNCCRHWSNVTQTGVFLFQFLASICVMLAAYQLCCFDVNLGNRRSSLLWSLASVYFCVLALPMGEDIFFYGGMVLWRMVNLCATHPLKANKPQETPEMTEMTEAADIPEAPETSAEPTQE